MKNLLIIIVLLYQQSIFSQESLGLRLDNYAGVNGLLLNPASGTLLPYSWDLNIVAAEQFSDNNYGFIRNTNLFNVLNNTDKVAAVTDYPNENQIPADLLVADFQVGNRKLYIQNNTLLMGPSFLFNLNNEHSFALLTTLRAAGGARQLPSILAYEQFEAISLNEEFAVNPFKIAGAAWAEIGLHYAYRTGENLSFGVNAKYLIGFEGFYFNSTKKAGLIKRTDNQIEFISPYFETGLTTTYLYNQTYNGVKKNGGGMAIDLGAIYTVESDINDGHLFKIGVSLLDLGYIRFNQNAEVHQFDNINPYSVDIDAYESITEYGDFIDLVNTDVYSQSGQSLSANQFTIVLPTALSIQVDYALDERFYINGTIVQHIPLGENRIIRSDVLAVTPRYEHRWFGVMVPVNILNYDQVHLGLALRLAWLTIGSENLGSLRGRNDFTGSSLYFALKVNPFGLGERDNGWKSKNKRGVKRRGRGRGKVKCYDF